MDDKEKNPPVSPDTQTASVPQLDAKGLARRRFTRAGAGATGIILTLHSQPGMAIGEAVCVSPSGYMSMKPGASASPQQACGYNRSHGYWKTHASAWKGDAGIAPEAKFGRLFLCAGKYLGLAKVSLMEIVDPNDTVKAIDTNNVAMHTIAALLNARAARIIGTPSVLPEARVMEIWDSFVTKGYYSPGAGATPWSGSEIATYLQSTFR